MSSGNTHTHIVFFYLCLLIQIRWFKSCITAWWLVSDLHSLLESSFVTRRNFVPCIFRVLTLYTRGLQLGSPPNKKKTESRSRQARSLKDLHVGGEFPNDGLPPGEQNAPTGKNSQLPLIRKTTEFKKSRQLQCAKYAKMSQNEIHSCVCG